MFDRVFNTPLLLQVSALYPKQLPTYKWAQWIRLSTALLESFLEISKNETDSW